MKKRNEKSDFFFQIDANAEDCYYDRVKSGTKMGLIFEVAEGGALDIDVKIEGKFSLLSPECSKHIVLSVAN